MKLLAFDTSTEHLSIAVSRVLDARVQVWTHDGPGGAMASSTLIPAALALLAQAGLTLRELDAIVFGAGPGSFTGLRTACAVAQGLGYGAGVPLLPADLNLRGALSLYRSAVSGIPGPDNRLEQQQPWQFATGFDHRLAASPLGFGANLSYTPGYTTQQTAAQTLTLGRARSIDAYASWTFSREAVARLSANNVSPLDSVNSTRTVEAGGFLLSSLNERQSLMSVNLSLNLKL